MLGNGWRSSAHGRNHMNDRLDQVANVEAIARRTSAQFEVEFRRQLEAVGFSPDQIDSAVDYWRADVAIGQLVHDGAAFVHAPGSVPIVVGVMASVGPMRWFWWEAGGETEFHGHVLDADKAEILYGGTAVAFRRGGETVGYLTTFAEMYDDDAAAEASAAFLKEWRAEYARSPGVQAFVERLLQECAREVGPH